MPRRRCPHCSSYLADLTAEDILDLNAEERRRALALLAPKTRPDLATQADKLAEQQAKKGAVRVDDLGRVKFFGPQQT